MDDRDRLRLDRALEAARKARDWSDQLPRWWENEIHTAAIAKMVEEVGDALMSTSQGRVSDQTQAAFPRFPWDFVGRIRVVLAHQYGQVDVAALRRTVERDVPRWVTELENMVRGG